MNQQRPSASDKPRTNRSQAVAPADLREQAINARRTSTDSPEPCTEAPSATAILDRSQANHPHAASTEHPTVGDHTRPCGSDRIPPSAKFRTPVLTAVKSQGTRSQHRPPRRGNECRNSSRVDPRTLHARRRNIRLCPNDVHHRAAVESSRPRSGATAAPVYALVIGSH
jgi:hypothetical protein